MKKRFFGEDFPKRPIDVIKIVVLVAEIVLIIIQCANL